MYPLKLFPTKKKKKKKKRYSEYETKLNLGVETPFLEL